MRKHFLILMLIALLPLASWADSEPTYPVDISTGWNVQFTDDLGAEINPAITVYTGADLTPNVRLVKGTEYIPASKLNISWNPSADRVNVPGNGFFEVTVTPNNSENGTYGSFSGKKKIYVLKAEIKLNGTTPAKAGNHVWDGAAWPLVATAPTLLNNFGGATKIEYSIDNKQTWTEEIPAPSAVGDYEVWYRAEGNSNLAGIEPTTLGTVQITGINYNVTTDYTLPTPKSSLQFTWDENAAKATDLALINEGSVIGNVGSTSIPKGTMKYAWKKAADTDYSEYSTVIPKAHDAGTYNVMWKIFPSENTGYIAKEAAAPIDVTISPIEPATVTSATGKTGLKYLGDGAAAQPLLEGAGSASDGATPKYQIKKPGETDFAVTAVDFADVTGDVAGDYEIKTIVPTAGNYTEKVAASTITVTIGKAKALTADPTAIANLTWKNAKQKLFNAGAGTVSGKVKYILTTDATAPATADPNWKTDIDDDNLKGSDAKIYHAWYQVTDVNYETVAPKAIGTTAAPVEIKPATVSIIVNNASKTYDGTGKIKTEVGVCDIAPNEGVKFSVTNAVQGAAVSVDGLKYTNENDGLGDNYKNVDTYVDALTADAGDVATINSAWGTNYTYTIVPGNLTINPRPIYVEANDGLSAKFGEAYDISKGYTIKGGEPGNVDVNASTATPAKIANFFTVAPVLTALEADPILPAVKAYDLAFTAGTTAANYTMDLTKGENHDGYFINSKKFTVNEDPTHKLVITVLPHKQKYTGVAESWANPVEGVDYVVTGLIPGDEITKKPTFTRETPEKLDVKYDGDAVIGYTLSADLAEVTNKAAHYPGGIIYNNSTFTIEPVELTATVNPQTIAQTSDAAAALAAIDQTAWKVTGMVNNEPQTKLGGSLTINAGSGPGQANINAVEVYAKGIKLTINKGNYVLKTDTEYGELRVIATSTVELNDTKDVTTVLAALNNSTTTDITFNSRTLKEDTWNTLILPFDITVRKLSEALDYAVVDMLDVNNTDPSKVIFKITTGTIKANTPFMVKTDANKNLQSVFIDHTLPVNIEYTATTTGVVADKAGNKLTGAYKPQTVNDGEYYMNGEGNWKLYAGTGFEIKGERVKFTKASATSAAPTFYIEEGDGTMTVINGETTSIETISAEKLNAAEGWYTLNGVKLQSMPTQKGIYINNGKKVVIK